MLPKSKLGNIALAGVAALMAVLVATAPLSAAMTYGVGIGGVPEAKKQGWAPGVGQFWIGIWTKSSGWQGLTDYLNAAKAQGVTPVIEWYYWGDSISVNCVKHGCAGRTQGDWNAMGATLAKEVRRVMGNSPAIIIVETEFNKGGVEQWEDFDGMLASHMGMMRYHAPNAKFYLGFGSWGQNHYSRFDRAMGTADGAGFQLMYASTRHSDAEYAKAPQVIKDMTLTLHQFGKPIILHDIALSSYDGREWLQEKVVGEIAARRAEYGAAGLSVMIWRDMKDNPTFRTTEYFGIAERYWGLLRADGSPKPAWWAWKSMASGGSTTHPDPVFDVGFTGVKGNVWWIQTSLTGSPAAKVEARVNGGPWHALDKQSWGGYAKSIHAPHGSVVELRATSASGAQDYSGKYNWPSATPATGSPSTPGQFSAKWGGVKGNEWWQQVAVSGGSGIAAVHVKVNNGAWEPMKKEGWGDWTSSVHAPRGAQVQFRATDTQGNLAWSAFHNWPRG